MNILFVLFRLSTDNEKFPLQRAHDDNVREKGITAIMVGAQSDVEFYRQSQRDFCLIPQF